MNGTTALFPGDLPTVIKPRLLLAEDEPSFSIFLCELLSEEYEVEVAGNGEQAWAATRHQLPDIILSDVQMPLLDGIALTRRLRADEGSAAVPVILMTANNQRDVLHQALDAGIDDFLLKPFHPLELLARLGCQRRMIGLRWVAAEQFARKQSEAVERVKNQFLSGLSHELRTPLTPVQFALHHLRQIKGLPVSVYEAVETIRRNVEVESRLVNDLLDVSQIVDGRMEVDLLSIDLHDCLGLAIRECREDYVPKALQLTVNLDAQRHEIMGDANRLRQVFCRVIQNAGKFTPAHGRVTVRSTNDGEDIVVEVQDSGIGIAAEHLPGLFKPFRRGTSTQGQDGPGLGLGLAISHAIVTAHEGQLTAASPGLDQGSTFRVCLNTKANFDSRNALKRTGPELLASSK